MENDKMGRFGTGCICVMLPRILGSNNLSAQLCVSILCDLQATLTTRPISGRFCNWHQSCTCFMITDQPIHCESPSFWTQPIFFVGVIL